MAVEISDATGNAQHQAEARLALAQVHLDRHEWLAARQVAASAPAQGFPPVLVQMFAALGIAELRAGDPANAADTFSAALAVADALQTGARAPIRVLYAKGIASAGYALSGQAGSADAARHAFELAQTVPATPGLQARALRQLDLLVPADADGLLAEIRRVLSPATATMDPD